VYAKSQQFKGVTAMASGIFAPFLWLWKGLQAALAPLDHCLVWFARLFGVNVREPGKRYAILLGIYAAIYVIALLPIPVVPLVALAVGYLGILAVGRAWVLNEKRRILIVKQLEDGNPDDMPDLRWTALVSALQLVILFPLVFMQAQQQFGLYKVPEEGATLWTWMLFTLDSYNKAVLGLLEVYGIHIRHIEYDSSWGRHLVTLCRLTFDFLLIQGIVRLFAIRETIREAVAAVGKDEDISVRVGRRAVKPLLPLLQDQDASVRKNVADALGKLGDARAVEPLLPLLQDQDKYVRSEAVGALGKLRDARAVEPLLPLLQDQAEVIVWGGTLREEVAEVLGKLGDARAVEPLLPLLQDQNDWVRGRVAEALGSLRC
jgi:hypothetical protein